MTKQVNCLSGTHICLGIHCHWGYCEYLKSPLNTCCQMVTPLLNCICMSWSSKEHSLNSQC